MNNLLNVFVEIESTSGETEADTFVVEFKLDLNRFTNLEISEGNLVCSINSFINEYVRENKPNYVTDYDTIFMTYDLDQAIDYRNSRLNNEEINKYINNTEFNINKVEKIIAKLVREYMTSELKGKDQNYIDIQIDKVYENIVNDRIDANFLKTIYMYCNEQIK